MEQITNHRGNSSAVPYFQHKHANLYIERNSNARQERHLAPHKDIAVAANDCLLFTMY